MAPKMIFFYSIQKYFKATDLIDDKNVAVQNR